ncbi:MAG: hypothetical protein ABW019_05225, partial [Chitinophagaceae bacterium]
MNIKSTWTVAIIAQYDGNDKLVKVTYDELEAAICDTPFSSRINYVIYRFDQKNSQALIREPDYTQEPVKMKNVDVLAVTDFYSGVELTAFMNRHVKKLSPVEDHGYIIMTWGHGMGLGLFPTMEEIVNKTGIKSRALSSQDTDLLRSIQIRRFIKAQFPVQDAGDEQFHDKFMGVADTAVRKVAEK